LDIGAIKNSIDLGISPQVANSTFSTPALESNQIDMIVGRADKLVTAQANEKLTKRPTVFQELTQKTEAMNKFVNAMETNIQFKLHEGTNQLMVQVVDQDSNKVLKEFPPSEFLDTIAAIRDYVGILLDKKI